MLNKL